MASSALRTVLVAATTAMQDTTSANSTSAESSETSAAGLLNDRINLIAATTLPGFTYGIVTALYCMTTYFLLKKLFRSNARSGSHPQMLSRSRTEWRKMLFYTIYTSVLFILGTLYTAGTSRNAIAAYVDNRLYPGGPYQYYAEFIAGHKAMIMLDVASLIILWMTDALILYRFIVFYYNVPYARWIIPLPCAMYVGIIVLSTLSLYGGTGSGKMFYLSENMLLSFYALSFLLSVFATALIAARLIWHKIQLERVFGPQMGSTYTGIATVLIESAALYGAWSFVVLVLCILQSPGQTIILVTTPHIQVIAPLLIIIWIARGKAWKHNKRFGESADDVLNELPSSDVGRVSFGSRPTRAGGEFCADNICSSGGRNASWSEVTGSGRAERGDVNVIELGLYDPQPSSTTDDLNGMKQKI